jgi:hypothetical protein
MGAKIQPVSARTSASKHQMNRQAGIHTHEIERTYITLLWIPRRKHPGDFTPQLRLAQLQRRGGM